MRPILSAIAITTAILATAGCGGGGGNSAVAPPPDDIRRAGDRDAAGVRLRRHGARRDAGPVSRGEPGLDLKVATFDSNKAAAAKLAGGFEADVVEVCTDEMQPLLARDLIRPLDPKAIANFDDSRSPTPTRSATRPARSCSCPRPPARTG